MKKYSWLCIGILLISCDMTASQDKPDDSYSREIIPYDLNNPVETFNLPGKLKEISGLAWYDDKIAAINDEEGKIFIIDQAGKVIEEFSFDDGDNYEGITASGETLFVVQANGDIHRVDKAGNNAERIETPLSNKNDVEGVAFDKSGNRLLIACKGNAGIDKNIEGRAIYAYNLGERSFSPEPVLIIKGDDLNKHLKERSAGHQLDKFAPSGIAFHPDNGNLYIISHQGKSLVVLDKSFQLLEVVKLSSKEFMQPEGICFAPDGTLFISNEGKSGKANILKFTSGAGR